MNINTVLIRTALTATLVFTIAPAIAEQAHSTISPVDLKPCAYQQPPTLVDGQWADQRDMRRLDKEIRTYVEAMQASLACVDGLLERQLADTDRQMLDNFYNNGVDQMTFIVEEYNKQVREFRLVEHRPAIDTPDNVQH